MGSCLTSVLSGQSTRLRISLTSSKGTKLALLWWAAPGRQTSVCAAWASHRVCTSFGTIEWGDMKGLLSCVRKLFCDFHVVSWRAMQSGCACGHCLDAE